MTIHPLSYSLPTAWDPAIDGWLTWLIAAGTSPATRKTRRSHVRVMAHAIGAQHPRDVTGADLLAILGRPGYSIEHRRGRRNSLASFYRWCVEQGVVEVDPTLTLPHIRTPAGAPKPATDDIWQALLEQADPRTALMARLACEAGLRRAEVAQVHTDDLNAGIGGAELIVHGKGGKQRVVPITVSLAAAITAACPHGGFLFPGKIDGHMSADRVGHLVSAVMPKGWSMHRLRHRFASRGYAATGNLRAMQEALGHASVSTTQRYAAVSAREIRAVVEAAAYSSPAPENANALHNAQSTAPHVETPSGTSESAAPAAESEVLRNVTPEPIVAEISAYPNGQVSPPVDEDALTETAAFEGVMSTWDEVLRCEVSSLVTHDGPPCRRPAKFRLNLHGCLQLLICERGLKGWKRKQLAFLSSGRTLACVHCGQVFERFDDACTVTPL
jgi:integrase